MSVENLEKIQRNFENNKHGDSDAVDHEVERGNFSCNQPVFWNVISLLIRLKF